MFWENRKRRVRNSCTYNRKKKKSFWEREEKTKNKGGRAKRRGIAVDFLFFLIQVRVRLLYNNIGYISGSDSTWVLVEFWGIMVNVMI